MKKKNKFKSWLIQTLRKWLSKLGSDENVVKIERVTVPLVTLEAKTLDSRIGYLPEDSINEILAQELGKQIIKYCDIQRCTMFDVSPFDTPIMYRATVRVAADKRG